MYVSYIHTLSYSSYPLCIFYMFISIRDTKNDTSCIICIIHVKKYVYHTYGVISKILYPESVANALSLRIYRTPPCKFNCPSRPKIQKNNIWIIDFDQNSAHLSSAKLFYSELLEQLGLLAMQAPWPMPSYLYLPTQELAMFAVCRFYEFVSGRLCVSAGFI